MGGKCYLEIGFANTVFHKRVRLLIFEAEFAESVVWAKTSQLMRLCIGALEGNTEQCKNMQFMHLSYRATFSCGWLTFQEEGTFTIRFHGF